MALGSVKVRSKKHFPGSGFQDFQLNCLFQLAGQAERIASLKLVVRMKPQLRKPKTPPDCTIANNNLSVLNFPSLLRLQGQAAVTGQLVILPSEQ